MFEQKSLNKIDGDYFNIIIADSQDVTIQSRNTMYLPRVHRTQDRIRFTLLLRLLEMTDIPLHMSFIQKRWIFWKADVWTRLFILWFTG